MHIIIYDTLRIYAPQTTEEAHRIVEAIRWSGHTPRVAFSRLPVAEVLE